MGSGTLGHEGLGTGSTRGPQAKTLRLNHGDRSGRHTAKVTTCPPDEKTEFFSRDLRVPVYLEVLKTKALHPKPLFKRSCKQKLYTLDPRYLNAQSLYRVSFRALHPKP